VKGKEQEICAENFRVVFCEMEAQAEVEEVVLRLSKSHRPFNAGLYGEMVRQGFAKLWEGELFVF